MGGVSEYAALLAGGLAEAGRDVHVLCPASPQPVHGKFTVHAVAGEFSDGDLARCGELLDRSPAPRQILVQWVPHGYGRRSMNLAFCRWIRDRALSRGDLVDLMVHEPGYALFEGWKQTVLAVAHRRMVAILLEAARRVRVSTPAWIERLRPLAARDVPFEWAPIPSLVPVVADEPGAAAIRARYGSPLIGYFGPYNEPYAGMLAPVLARLPDRVLLIGRGSDTFAANAAPRNAAATGSLSLADVSRHIAACDLMLHLYPDGVDTRRSTAMASLAHGRCLVTTDGRFTEPVWRESSAVTLVPAGDADAAVAAVTRLLADPAERTRKGEAGRRLHRERFDIEHTVRSICESR